MTKPHLIRPTALAPRNPLVSLTRCRGGAGRHGPTQAALRQRGLRALRHELEDLHPPHR